MEFLYFRRYRTALQGKEFQGELPTISCMDQHSGIEKKRAGV